MRLGSLRHPLAAPDLDDVVAAYRIWRYESAAVHSAYRTWQCAPARDARKTFAAYQIALDCEEEAAQSYARILDHARHRPEIDLVRQIRQLAVEMRPT